jgi:hypothetical protein
VREAAAAEELAEALRRDFFVEESSDAAAEEAVASGANAPLAVGLGRYCPSRHRYAFRPSFL